jgi:hypothetical protein
MELHYMLLMRNRQQEWYEIMFNILVKGYYETPTELVTYTLGAHKFKVAIF